MAVTRESFSTAILHVRGAAGTASKHLIEKARSDVIQGLNRIKPLVLLDIFSLVID
jgi:hypothetical protein